MQRGVKGRPDLRVVNGTERPDKVPGQVDIEPADPSEVKRPGFVKGKAKRIWDDYAEGRIAAGFLRSEDAHLFGQLCCRLADYEANPGAFKSADMAELRKRLECFGMAGPTSRARFKTSGKKESPANKYLSR